MNKWIGGLFYLLLGGLTVGIRGAEAQGIAAQGNDPAFSTLPPTLSADGAYLADLETGAELFAKNADKKEFPASTTKIMTALLAAEHGCLDEIVTISPKAAEVGEASIWLEAGEKVQLENLLAAALMKSANDACVAIAEHISGSEEAFVRRMNQRAWELGARNTHFVNPHGLHDPNHYTTARDLVTIARAALRQPVIRRFCAQKEFLIPWAGHPWPRTIRNLNQLLWRYPGADGVKTGKTQQAGPCLVFSASREGWQIVGAVLKAPRRWEDSEFLLQYGFQNFEPRRVIRRGMVLQAVPVVRGVVKQAKVVSDRDVTLVFQRGQPDPAFQIFLPRILKAPLEAHTPLGHVWVRGYQCSGYALLCLAHDLKAVWWAALADKARLTLSPTGFPVALLLCWMIYGTFAKSYRQRRSGLATPRRRSRSGRPGMR
ncbi:MAG: D-alanyl-D-alanine carboxypeptidase family protein [Candidatus Hadarchaeum sp.]